MRQVTYTSVILLLAHVHENNVIRLAYQNFAYLSGMQSSLLALALANRFFPDPLVSIPPAISVSHNLETLVLQRQKFLFHFNLSMLVFLKLPSLNLLIKCFQH